MIALVAFWNPTAQAQSGNDGSVARGGTGSSASMWTRTFDREAPSQYFTRIELSYGLLTGPVGTSLQGTQSIGGLLGRERREGSLRVHFGLGYDQVTGSTVLGLDSVSVNLTTIQLIGGAHLYYFPVGRLRPFIGASAVYGLGLYRVDGSSQIEGLTRPKTTGYELSMGVDLASDINPTRKPYLRIRFAWSRESGAFPEISGFSSDAFRIILGI